MSEWVYKGNVCYGCTAGQVVWMMLEDEDNDDVRDEFFEWFEDFGENNPETTLLAFISSYCDGVARVSDMMHDLKDLFADWLAHRPGLMAYCGAELVDDDELGACE